MQEISAHGGEGGAGDAAVLAPSVCWTQPREEGREVVPEGRKPLAERALILHAPLTDMNTLEVAETETWR